MASHFFLRIARHPGVWKPDNTSQLDEDFKDDQGSIDTNLSLYRQEKCSLIQLSSEFSCTFRKLKKPVDWFDITSFIDGIQPVPVPNEGIFSTLSSCHFELQVDASVVIRIVDRVRNALNAGSHQVARIQPQKVSRYAAVKLKMGDIEWLNWQREMRSKSPDLVWLKEVDKIPAQQLEKYKKKDAAI